MPTLTTVDTLRLVQLAEEILRELAKRSGSPAQSRNAASTKSSPVGHVPCRNCQQPVVLAKTELNDEWIVLDEAPGEYDLVDRRARWVGSGGSYTFHFAGCPGSADAGLKEADESDFETLTKELWPGRLLADGE
jgi:hypothetical protein